MKIYPVSNVKFGGIPRSTSLVEAQKRVLKRAESTFDSVDSRANIALSETFAAIAILPFIKMEKYYDIYSDAGLDENF